MNVSIIIPIHKPNKYLLNKILDKIKSQKFKGKIEVIKVEMGLGLAASLNYGIKKAKYPIIVSLHQDCMPSSLDWLENLTKPLKSKEVVAATSKVEMPKELWGRFDAISKILSVKEQKVITPLLDEKGCAYKKSDLLKVGLFDEKNFKTAGEDFDIYIKISKLGKIVYPDAKVIHYHSYSWKTRLRKELQLSNGFGALVRIYGKSMHGWYIGLLKSIPLLGYIFFLPSINVSRLKFLSILALPLYLLVNFIYSYGFWKGFLMAKQTV